MSFFTELKRRNVIRVAIAYLAGGWLLIQIIETTFPAFGLSSDAVRFVVIALSIGLLPVLVVSWVFEFTSDGFRRDKAVDHDHPDSIRANKRLNQFIIVILSLALGYFAYDKFILDPARDQKIARAAANQVADGDRKATIPGNSIAVLPFVNMSDDASNEYFSEGLSEELLNMLVKIPELRVAARTSSFSYKEKDVQISEIARDLRVSNVLEGSVRKSGDKVRITVQLIRAADGFHRWSQTYDRTLDDIFVVQDEIAAAVVGTLKVKLLGSVPKTKETLPEVYSLFLKARYLNNFGGEDSWTRAEAAFKQAIAIDPEYAPAWAGLSSVYRYQANSASRDFDFAMSLARETDKMALSLDDQLASAWASQGYGESYNDWNWVGAKSSFEKALRLEPGNAEVLKRAAAFHVMLGQFDDAISLFEKAIGLDPLGSFQRNGLGHAYISTAQLDLAQDTFRQLLDLHPEEKRVAANLARVLLLKGNLARALESLGPDDEVSWHGFDRALILISMGEAAEAEAFVAKFLEKYGADSYYKIAQFYAWQGDIDSAFKSLELALEVPVSAMAYVLSNPVLAILWEDDRWPIFLETMGLGGAWEALSSSIKTGEE